MRILIVSNLFPPSIVGGYEVACAAAARALAERGHAVRVLTSWTHLPIAPEEAAYVERSLDLSWFVPHPPADVGAAGRDRHAAICSCYPNTLRLLQALRDFRADVVYCWNLIGIGAAALMDMLNQLDVPWALHLMDRGPTEILQYDSAAAMGLFNAQGPGLYRRARILSMSQTLLDEIAEAIHFTQEVEIVPGWADVAAVPPHGPYRADGITRFVAAGSIAEHKGVDLILEAAARLRAANVPFRIDLFGDGDLPRYIDRARSMKLDDCVRFRGPRPQKELLALYGGYDAFLFPTWVREPFGLVAVEAAACGTPPIITRACGAAERLVDGVHCLKIERTLEDLVDAMARVAAGAVDLERIGRAGHRLVASDLSLTRCIERIEAVLQDAARPWRQDLAGDPQLPLLAFLKHNLSMRLRFG